MFLSFLESPAYLIDLMHDQNSEVRNVCDYCLDIIAFTDTEWASRIKVSYFSYHRNYLKSFVRQTQK